MVRKLAILAAHALATCGLLCFLSCASDKKQTQNDFATLGDDAGATDIADELTMLEGGGLDDLEKSDNAAAGEDLAELESELGGSQSEAAMPPEESDDLAELEAEGLPGLTEEPSEEGELSELLEGGGDASPESGGPRRARGGMASSAAQVPTIPPEAFEKAGALLNRFYFIRSGDTWDGISSKIYGTGAQAGPLQTWNGRSLTPGRLIFFESPRNRSDSRMMSYYEENGLQPESYSLGRGETLSSVAQDRYGDFRSWKEIAAMNGITDPDSLAPGQSLILYPGDGSFAANTRSSRPERVARAEPPPSNEPEPVAEPAEDLPQFEQPPPPPPVRPQAFAPPPPPPPVAVTRSQRSRVSVARLLQQNMFALSILGIIIILVISLVVLNKRKKAALGHDELMDDAFGQPRMKKK